jgi:hypothetical protein
VYDISLIHPTELNILLKKSQESKLLNRQAGLGKGTIWISNDFDESLPDSFWLG